MPTTPAYIQVATDGAGKKVDTCEVTTSAGVVERQVACIGDPIDPLAYASVENQATLTGDEYGIVALVGVMRDVSESLKQNNRILARALGLAADNSTGRLRCAVDINAAQTLATVTTVGTVTTCTTVSTVTTCSTVSAVTTVNQVAGFDAKAGLTYATERNNWANAIRARIT
jgi:hypothetical protein